MYTQKATRTDPCSSGNEQKPIRPHQKRSMRHAMLHIDTAAFLCARPTSCSTSSSYILFANRRLSIPTCEFWYHANTNTRFRSIQ